MVIATDDLELTCPHCEGTGEEKEGTPCPKCGAKGVILTAQGNTLRILSESILISEIKRKRPLSGLQAVEKISTAFIFPLS